MRAVLCPLAFSHVARWLAPGSPARKPTTGPAPPVLPPHADDVLKQEATQTAARCLAQAAEADNFATAIASCGYSNEMSSDLADHARHLRESYKLLTAAIRAAARAETRGRCWRLAPSAVRPADFRCTCHR